MQAPTSYKAMPKFHYQCLTCHREYPPEQATYLCPHCEPENAPGKPPKGVLKTLYDYDSLRRQADFPGWEQEQFLPLLPITSAASLPNLRVGNTPLYELHKLGKAPLPFRLYLKDDSQNPTYSFKDRASALVSAYAREHGWNIIVAASTGNAGSSIAGICAAQGQQAVVFVPASAPLAKLTQILMYGACIVPVEGSYDQAFELSIEATKAFGWYNRNTAYNPLTIEGKKTVSFELFSQLGQSIPDQVFVSVGDGVILSGLYKGFEDLLKAGLTEKMPRVIGVQAAGSSNLADNIGREHFSYTPSRTVADSIAVDIPANFYMAAAFTTQYGGAFTTVSDEEILEASARLSRATGLFAEPAAAAALAGMLQYREEGKIEENSRVVVLLTGSGLKDLQAMQGAIRMPAPVPPEMEAVRSYLAGIDFGHF